MANIERWYYWPGFTKMALEHTVPLEFVPGAVVEHKTDPTHGPVIGYVLDDSAVSTETFDQGCAELGLYPLPDPTTEPPGIYARITTLESAIPMPQYLRLERSAALSVSSGSPEIPFDTTAEASDDWDLDSGAAMWTGAANTPVRGHASVAFTGISLLTSVTVSVWKNRGGAGEKLVGRHIERDIVVAGETTTHVPWRALVSENDTISVEAVPNGVLEPSLVVGGATHLEIG